MQTHAAQSRENAGQLMTDYENAELCKHKIHYILLFKIYCLPQDVSGPLECLFGSILTNYGEDFYLTSWLTSYQPKQTSFKEQIYCFSYL